MKDKTILRRLALTALLTAFAAALGYIDAILPLYDFLPVPGLKLGLANLAVLFTLCLLGWKEALAVSFIRILIVNLLLFPSPTAFAFSLAGGALSFLAMWLLQKLSLHPISMSVVGSICHNLAQTVTAVVMLKTPQLFSYLVFLLPVGLLSGALIGLLVSILLPRVRAALEKSK